MPLLLPLAVPFFALIAALVLAGLSKSAAAQHGSSNSGTFWDTITGRTYLHQLSGFAASFARWIVSRFAASQLRLLTRWFIAMGTLTLGWFLGNAAFSEAVVEALERIEHRGDPKARAKAQTANRHAIHAGHTATHANVHARSVGHALDRHKARVNPQLRHLTHATTVALPRDIARVRHRERWAEKQLWKVRDRAKSLEDGAIKTWEWIRDHPDGAITGAFAGAVAIALTRLGLDSIRCRSLRNLYNNRGCNMWSELEGLLAAATLVVGALSLVEMAREEQKVVGEAAKIVRGFWEV